MNIIRKSESFGMFEAWSVSWNYTHTSSRLSHLVYGHLCYLCHVFVMLSRASVHCCLVVTCWERADLLVLVMMFNCVFVTFPCGILGRYGSWLYRFLIFATLLTLVSEIGRWAMSWSNQIRDGNTETERVLEIYASPSGVKQWNYVLQILDLWLIRTMT